MEKGVNIGLMGLGVIGGGVAKALMEKSDIISTQAGCPIRIRRILERRRERATVVGVDATLLTDDPRHIIDDPEVDIIVELLGGEYPALDLIKEGIIRGKNVVTANKEVMAKHGPQLLSLAGDNGVDILFEASVGGGIPLIAPFKFDLAANEISAIYAIINGTTNYILTRMAREGVSFHEALSHAQGLGYAEADPRNDIEGIDAVYKLAIMATLAFHTEVGPQDIYHEGISRITSLDFRYAQELGYQIKLLAIAKRSGEAIEVRVHPTFVPEEYLLAKVDGVYNAVQVEGDLVGRVLFYGEGAGPSATSSAVLSDIMELCRRINLGVKVSHELHLDPTMSIRPVSDIETRYYLRMSVADRPGVLAQITRILGDNLISISSVIQKGQSPSSKTAEIVIMTHPAKEAAMMKAIGEMENLDVVREISNFIRVEG